MDNLTHSLVGLLVAKTGLERVSPYATSASIIAASAPDLDLISVLGGRWSYLEHHRGVSHSIVGVIAISLGVALLFALIEFLVARSRGREPSIKLRGLMLVCLVAGATHPILDWTNNYGIRPLLPFDSRWFYGDLAFVFDPWIWLILGGAGFLIASNSKIRVLVWSSIAFLLSVAIVVGFAAAIGGFPRVQLITVAGWFVGLVAIVLGRFSERLIAAPRRVAMIALLLIPLYWCGLAFMRHRARNAVEPMAAQLIQGRGERLERLAVMPTFGDPRRWQTIAESTGASYRFLYSGGRGASDSAPIDRIPVPTSEEAPLVEWARSEPEVQVFLRFARFPVVRVDGRCPDETIVRFADLRYTEPGAGRAGFAVDVPVRCDQVVPRPPR